MPIFKGRNGEVFPSKRNPNPKKDDEEESYIAKKVTFLCSNCKKKFVEFIKSENTIAPKACDKCKEIMKDLSWKTRYAR